MRHFFQNVKSGCLFINFNSFIETRLTVFSILVLYSLPVSQDLFVQKEKKTKTIKFQITYTIFNLNCYKPRQG